MSNHRINKKIAQTIACRVATVSFNEKLEALRKKLRSYVDELINKHLPHPVLHVTSRYGEFFRVTSQIYVKCASNFSMLVKTNYNIPYACEILVEKDEYEKLKSLRDELRKMEYSRDSFSYKIQDVLCDLRTEKRVREKMPEVAPYLESYFKESDETPEKDEPLESLRKEILTPKKNEKEEKQ